MKSYSFSKRAKIRETLKYILFFGSLIVGVVFIGNKISFLYFISRLLIFFIIYFIICMLCYYWGTSFFVNEKTIITKGVFNITDKVFWKDINKIRIIKRNKSIKQIEVSIKNEKKPIVLSSDLKNCEEIFDLILKEKESRHL